MITLWELVRSLSLSPLLHARKVGTFFREKAERGRRLDLCELSNEGGDSRGGRSRRLGDEAGDSDVGPGGSESFCIWPCYWSQLHPIAAVGFAVGHVRISGPFDVRFDSEMAGIELHPRGRRR